MLKIINPISPPESIPSLLRQAVADFPERRLIAWLKPQSSDPPLEISYGQFETMVRQAVAVLQKNGVGAGKRILLFAENSPAWQIMAMAAQVLRAEPVGIFYSLGKTEVEDILLRVQPSIIFISSWECWVKIQSTFQSLSHLQKVITFGEMPTLPTSVPVLPYEEILQVRPLAMEEYENLLNAVGEEDPFVMLFTSGTTGKQKGVRLPQRAALSAIRGGAYAGKIETHHEGLHILPFAHIAGLVAFYITVQSVCGLILVSHRDDLPKGFSFGPHYTLLVPFFYERIYKSVLGQIEQKNFLVKSLLLRALQCLQRKAEGQDLGWLDRCLVAFAAQTVGKKLRKKLGGKIKVLGAGGAPSPKLLAAFFRGLGFEYLNLYGMTETCGVISLNCVGDPHLKLKGAGRPWREMEVQVDRDGEILVKGKTLMRGYLEAEDEVGVFTEDGFFRTGDLGYMDEDGYLYVTGRKKNILVLSTGKKISPEPIELKLIKNLPVEGAVVLGDGEGFVSAGLFMNSEVLEILKKQHGGEGVIPFLLREMKEKLGSLSHYQIPKQVFLIPGSPLDYPDLLTPTLKIRRDFFAEKFAKEISQIYQGRSIPDISPEEETSIRK